MQFELPVTQTTVILGQDISFDQRVNEIIRGHTVYTVHSNVLIIGAVPMLEHPDPSIVFVPEEEPIKIQRYSLIVVNYPQQTVFNNGLVLVEVTPERAKELQRLADAGMAFLAIVS